MTHDVQGNNGRSPPHNQASSRQEPVGENELERSIELLGSAKLTTGSNPQTDSRRMDLFDAEWAISFTVAWNNSDYAPDMASAGGVTFVAYQDHSQERLSLNWDSGGQAHVVRLSDLDTLPVFTAALDVWNQLISEKIGPIRAVATGKLKYRGPTRFPLRYIDGFRRVFRVAQGLTSPSKAWR